MTEYYIADDELEGRLFDPAMSEAHRRVPKSELVVYDPTKQLSGLQMYSYAKRGIIPDRGHFVVYIDGACRDNGKSAARASWGVYFGPGSRHNRCGLLRPDLPQTSSRAEIEALSQALDIIHGIVSRDYSLQHIKIATDSEYLAKSMALWMEEWIENDGLNSKGRRVVHFEKLKEIYERLEELTYGDDGGLEFLFWPIPREENREADRLANEALDRA
ncbi:Ribonuclease H1 [Colletotrichum chlorophyti]|uniref:ribonuclease H n=1 Tax=Colletotrichum chlorophyti TaxID=708187 RepID=A0A1Q8RT45_9PEZI|nr:Ribonuclease H1 [Colletotrichum chlorophyti]